MTCTSQSASRDENSEPAEKPQAVQELQKRVAELELLVEQLVREKSTDITAVSDKPTSPGEALNQLQTQIAESVDDRSSTDTVQSTSDGGHATSSAQSPEPRSGPMPIVNLFKSVVVRSI